MSLMNIRHTKLLNIVNEKKRVAVTELSSLLDVSEVTIRKDLSMLAQMGLLRREHGFASMSESDDIGIHLSFNYETKHRIALRAAETVHSGETIMIESGSCCTLLAKELARNRSSITIITNSAFIASFIRSSSSVHIILLGGDYQNESEVVVGPMVKKCLSDFSVNKLFVGIDGFDEGEFMSNNLMRAETIRAMAKHAKSVIVLTESVKFKKSGVAPLLPLNAIDAVYTDDGITYEAAQTLNAGNTHVYTVPHEKDE